MDTITKVFETADNKTIETPKKVWSMPFFEIISKDIIKGGPTTGSEGVAYFS